MYEAQRLSLYSQRNIKFPSIIIIKEIPSDLSMRRGKKTEKGEKKKKKKTKTTKKILCFEMGFAITQTTQGMRIVLL